MRTSLCLPLALSLLAIAVSGCECGYQPPCARFHQTDVVFLGHLQEGVSPNRGVYQFEVEEAFHGVAAGTKQLAIFGGPCTAIYTRGVRYLVMAVRYPNGTLSTDVCTGTIPADKAVDDIRMLRARAQGKPLQQLQGRVRANTEDSLVRFELETEHAPGLAGVVVTASRNGQQFTSTTQADGWFRIPVPEAGQYRLTARLAGYKSSATGYDLRTERGGCAEQNIGMWSNTNVRGVALEAARKPAAGIPVWLIPQTGGHGQKEITGSNGSFTFSKVPQGEYVLAVSPSGASSESPYDTRYYAGAGRLEGASRITVAGPDKTSKLKFDIGTRLPTRRIHVAARWADGRPVTNAAVVWESANHRDRGSRFTDARGEATLEVLANADYDIFADRLFWTGSALPVKQRTHNAVAAGTTAAEVRITVSADNDISRQQSPLPMNGRQR